MTFSFKHLVAACFLLGGSFLMLRLGFWQIERLEWKSSIIQELEAEYKKGANPPLLSSKEIENADKNILYGGIKGRLINDKTILVGPKTHKGAIGFHVLTPMDTGTGIVFVNRGWIADKDKNALSNDLFDEPVTATGIFRQADWNAFTPENNPDQDIWTKLDIAQMAQAKKLDNVASKILYLDKKLTEDDPVLPVHQKWYPRNKHKQYAIFWFSMAAVFLVFFALFAILNARQKHML